MDSFRYRKGELFCEGVPVRRIAGKVGTPVYIYSRKTIEDHYRKLVAAFRGVDTLVTYSVKSNSNLAILKILADLGAGFDIVSGGELFRVLSVGADPGKVVFAGVGKSEREITEAIRAGVGLFTVESEGELALINRVAGRLGRRARAALRVNPDVDPKTHRYTTTGKRENKFGLDLARARNIFVHASRTHPHVDLVGIHAHIGSQITSVAPYRKSLERIVAFHRSLPHPERVTTLDCGGGFGVHYRAGEAIPADAYARAMVPLVRKTGCRLLLEMGRFVVGNAGILVTEVQYVKDSGDKKFVICDAGMHTLIRPALYEAFHKVWPVATRIPLDRVDWTAQGWKRLPKGTGRVDIVGPICESADFFAKDRPLPPVARGDYLSVFTAGAYGFVMASRYNSHPLPAEVLVEGARFRVVKKAETYRDLLRGETA